MMTREPGYGLAIIYDIANSVGRSEMVMFTPMQQVLRITANIEEGSKLIIEDIQQELAFVRRYDFIQVESESLY